VGLGSKGAGSWEVPVTTLRSHKDGVREVILPHPVQTKVTK